MAALLSTRLARLVLGALGATVALATIGLAARELPGLISRPIEEQQRERALERELDRATSERRRDRDRGRAQAGGREEAPGGQALAARRGGENRGSLPGRVFGGIGDLLGLVVPALWRLILALLPGLAIIALPALAVAGTRHLASSRRRYRRYEIVPHDHRGSPSPLEVSRFFDQLHQRRIRRWYERLAFGQDAVTIEILGLTRETPEGTRREVKFGFACADDEATFESVRAAFKQAVSGASIEPRSIAVADDAGLNGLRGPHSLTDHVVRLKKAHSFLPRSLAIPVVDGERGEYGEPLAKTLANSLKRVPATTLVQYVLTPAPRMLEGYARLRFRQSEDRMHRDEEATGTRGASSELADEELERGAKGVAWRHLYFCEVRVASAKREAARSLAGDIQAHVKGANELRQREPRLGRRGYAKRILACLPSPIPDFSRSTYSTAELAALWQPPAFGQVRVPMRRTRVNLTISAPPEVWRPPAKLALARDKQGRVGIRLEDLPANHMVVGSHGSGKTTLMLRQAHVVAQVPDYALVAIDPKPELAEKLLGILPPWREPVVIDVDRPECGFDPFNIPGASADDVADSLIAGLIEVSRTEEGDSQIYQSSRRFYKMAIVGALAAYGRNRDPRERPSFWDVWKLLQPTADGKAERARISDTLASDAEFFGAQMGMEALAEQLRSAQAAFVQRLDAPTNKLELLTSASADRVLRHPHSVAIDDVIRRRGVLVVKGAAKNTDLTRTLNLFLLAHLHRAMLRQLDHPEAERAKVFLIGDEAHQLFCPTLEQMLSMNRAAGSQAMLAWQTMAQVPSRQTAGKILPLLKHRSIFNVGPEDARELAAYVQTETVDRYEPGRDPGRIAPHDLAALPVHTFAAAWVARGAPMQSFYGATEPLAESAERREEAMRAQRERGGRPLSGRPPLPARVSGQPKGDADEGDRGGPVRIDKSPPPVALADEGEEAQEQAPARDGTRPPERGVAQADAAGGALVASAKGSGSDTAVVGAAEGPSNAGPPEQAASADTAYASRQGAPAGRESSNGRAAPIGARRPEESASTRQRRERSAPARAEEPGTLSDGKLPEALDELVPLERPSDLRWEEVPEAPEELRLAPEELRALAALWRARFLTREQIRRHFFAQSGVSTVRKRVARWCKAGLVRRGALTIKSDRGGRGKPVFTITQEGFRACQAHRHRGGPYIDSSARFREPQIHEGKLLLHDLHHAAWVLRLLDLAANCVERWYGSAQSYIEVPRVRDDGRLRPVAREDLLGAWKAENLRVFNFPDHELRQVSPDARLEVVLDGATGARTLDFCVEYERAARAAQNAERLRAYEAMMAAWHRLVPRYQTLGRAPRLVYVAPTREVAVELARLADRTLKVAVGGYEGPHTWQYPARLLTYFAVESDIHRGSTRAYVVHPQPAEHRAKTAPRAERRDSAQAGWGIGVQEFIAAGHLLSR